MQYRRHPPLWLFASYVPLIAVVVWLATSDSAELTNRYGQRLVLVPVACAGVLVAGLVGYSFWEGARQARERHAIAAWGARNGLAFSWGGDKTPIAGARDAATENVVAGTVVGTRKGQVAHVAIPLRRFGFLAVVPLMNWVAFSNFDLWTVCQVTLRAAEVTPFRALRLRAAGLRDVNLAAALFDAATPLRHVELESVELHDAYALEVADDADDVAVRRAFSPALIVDLVERGGRPLAIELHGRTLTVAAPGRLLADDDLDALLAITRRVAGQLAPAIRDEETVATELPAPPRARAPRTMVVVAIAAIGLPFAFMVTQVMRLTPSSNGADAPSGLVDAGVAARAATTLEHAALPEGTTSTFRMTVVAGTLAGAGTLEASRRGDIVRLHATGLPRGDVWQLTRGDGRAWACRQVSGDGPACRATLDVGLDPVARLLATGGLARELATSRPTTASTTGGATCATYVGSASSATVCSTAAGRPVRIEIARLGLVLRLELLRHASGHRGRPPRAGPRRPAVGPRRRRPPGWPSGQPWRLATWPARPCDDGGRARRPRRPDRAPRRDVRRRGAGRRPGRPRPRTAATSRRTARWRSPSASAGRRARSPRRSSRRTTSPTSARASRSPGRASSTSRSSDALPRRAVAEMAADERLGVAPRGAPERVGGRLLGAERGQGDARRAPAHDHHRRRARPRCSTLRRATR